VLLVEGVTADLHVLLVNLAKDVNTAVKKVELVGFVKNIKKI
jgi:hypothetical protein